MAQERDTIQFGRSVIHYGIQRSQRRRTISILVDIRDGVTVKVPEAMPREKIAPVVRKKAPWILKRLADFAEMGPGLPPKEFISGEGFLYLGRRYRLKIHRSGYVGKTDVKLIGGRLSVSLPTDTDNESSKIRKEITKWYKEHAKQRLPERAIIYARRMGIVTPEILIRDQQKRWGSCSNKRELRFNWRIIMAPMPLVDYVVAHEMCHLKYPNHSTEFWKLLRKIMPDHEIRRERLRSMGMHFNV